MGYIIELRDPLDPDHLASCEVGEPKTPLSPSGSHLDPSIFRTDPTFLNYFLIGRIRGFPISVNIVCPLLLEKLTAGPVRIDEEGDESKSHVDEGKFRALIIEADRFDAFLPNTAVDQHPAILGSFRN
jgi:hypothetical protein